MGKTFMMIPHQHELVQVDREFRNRLYIEGLGQVMAETYFDEIGLGICAILAVLEPMKNYPPDLEIKEDGILRMMFDGDRSKSGTRIGIILEAPGGKIHPLIYHL